MDFFLLRIFQMQVRMQCKFFKAASHQLTAALAQNDDIVEINLDPELCLLIWGSIETMVNTAANISKILWGKPNSDLDKARKPIRDSLAVADDSPIRSGKMRNHFQHFDERIDRWAEESSNRHVADLLIGGDLSMPEFEEKERWRRFDPTTLGSLD